MDLQSMQSLMGRLNNVSIMCPFLNGFKKPLNETLGHLQRSGGQIPLTDQEKGTYWFGQASYWTRKNGIPFPRVLPHPPLEGWNSLLTRPEPETPVRAESDAET
jgi:hypothetical protein